MIDTEELTCTTQVLDVGRVTALAELVYLCKQNNVEIEKVYYFRNGFQLIFKDMDGDAILHDGSYGRHDNTWETIGFPWDGDDVSVHDSETLAKLLADFKNGKTLTDNEMINVFNGD